MVVGVQVAVVAQGDLDLDRGALHTMIAREVEEEIREHADTPGEWIICRTSLSLSEHL